MSSLLITVTLVNLEEYKHFKIHFEKKIAAQGYVGEFFNQWGSCTCAVCKTGGRYRSDIIIHNSKTWGASFLYKINSFPTGYQTIEEFEKKLELENFKFFFYSFVRIPGDDISFHYDGEFHLNFGHGNVLTSNTVLQTPTKSKPI